MPVELQPTPHTTRSEIAASLHEQCARLTRQVRALELPPGMSLERLSALAAIEKRGPISVKDLADNEMVGPPTMSRIVTGLVAEGLVKRGAAENDRRTVLISTTPRGRRVYQLVRAQRLRRFAEALDSLSADELSAMRNLTALLEQLASLLQKNT